MPFLFYNVVYPVLIRICIISNNALKEVILGWKTSALIRINLNHNVFYPSQQQDLKGSNFFNKKKKRVKK